MELKSLNNPVLSSDLKIRMRGWKTFLGIIVYLGIMVLIAFLYYITFIENTASYNMSINARQDMGVSIYTMLAALQFALIILITPAQTAGTISGEREKQTLDLLLCTSLSPLGIILGKLMSSMSYILLLIFSSIPLFSMVFLFGGVTPGDIVMLFLFYIITAISIGSIGIYFSTVFKRTVTATVVTYITVFTLGLVSVILGLFMQQLHSMNNPAVTGQYVPFILYINPALGLIHILTAQLSGQGGGIIMGLGQEDFWITNSLTMLAIAVVLLLLSVIRVNPVFHFRLRRKRKN